MTSDGTRQAVTPPETAQRSTALTLSLNAGAEASPQETRTCPSRSDAYAVLCEMLQRKAGEIEARCKKGKAWWMQGALRWKARVRQDLHTSRSDREADGIGEKDEGRSLQQRRHSSDESQPPHVSTLSCMNEFVLLRRVYGRGHLAKVTSALALTASLLPVAVKGRSSVVESSRSRENEKRRLSIVVHKVLRISRKHPRILTVLQLSVEQLVEFLSCLDALLQTYVVRALKRGRTAIFGADGMRMTNEYEKVRREIAVHSSLRHPNICPFYGVINEVETGCLHLVLQLLPHPLMEWVEELHAYTVKPLHASHRQQPFVGNSHVLVYTEDAVRRILRQVLDALDYLHSLNIVHKDIKPQNILSAAPPSPDDLIVAPLPRPQTSARRGSAEGPSTVEGPLRGYNGCEGDTPPPVTHNQDEQEIAALHGDEEEDRGGGCVLDGLVEERDGSSCESVGSSDGAGVGVRCRARHSLYHSTTESQCEGTPEGAPDWRESYSSSEETSFSETDSDEEYGVCDGGPHCTCTLVAELPESPAFRTALGVAHKRLSPYAAYAYHVRSPAKSNGRPFCRPRADVQTSSCHATEEQIFACGIAALEVDDSVEPNMGQNSRRHSSAQQPGRGSAPREQEMQESDACAQDDNGPRKVTLREPLSATGEQLSERCFPTTSARMLGGRPSPTENNSHIFDAASQMVGEADGVSADAGDALIKLARRIVMRRKREGRLRPLCEVIFEGEANVFPVQEKHEIAEGQRDCRVAGTQACVCRRTAFLEDAQLVSEGDGHNNNGNPKKVTSLPAQDEYHQTGHGDAAGASPGKEEAVVRTAQGKKRSRQRSESPDVFHDVHPFAESGTSPGLERAQEGRDSLVNSLSSPSIGLANDIWGGRRASATDCIQMAGASVSFGESACWKLADFGSACVADDDRLTIWDSEGTRHFTPPECLGVFCEEGWAGRPRDLWSVGVLLYCMFFGTLPFKGDSGLELSISIMNDNIAFPCHRALSESAKDTLRKLLCKDPTRRLTSEQLRRHPWLSDTACASREQPRQVQVLSGGTPRTNGG